MYDVRSAEDVCRVVNRPDFQEQVQSLPKLIAELEARRSDARDAIARLTAQADQEAGTGMGPRYRTLLRDINSLKAELQTSAVQLSEVELRVDRFKEIAIVAGIAC